MTASVAMSPQRPQRQLMLLLPLLLLVLAWSTVCSGLGNPYHTSAFAVSALGTHATEQGGRQREGPGSTPKTHLAGTKPGRSLEPLPLHQPSTEGGGQGSEAAARGLERHDRHHGSGRGSQAAGGKQWREGQVEEAVPGTPAQQPPAAGGLTLTELRRSASLHLSTALHSALQHASMWMQRIVGDKHWPPFEVNALVVMASLISVVGAALANAGGVGGGGLFVPMFSLLLGYDAKTSTALSKSMIMGGAIASVCFNVQLKHPHNNSPLIDYGIARLMQPMLLLGISIGVICNVMFPPWLIILLLCTVLIVMTWKTLDKGVATWCREAAALQDRAVRQAPLAASHAASIPTPGSGAHEDGGLKHVVGEDGGKSQTVRVPAILGAAAGSEQQQPQQQQLRRERRRSSNRDESLLEPLLVPADEGDGVAAVDASALDSLPLPSPARLSRQASIVERYGLGTAGGVTVWELVNWAAVAELVLVWVLYCTIQMFKSHTEDCSLLYWILNGVQIPISLIATAIGATRLYEEHKQRLTGDHRLGPYSEGDVQWNAKEVLLYPSYALLAGTVGGLLGIGGGMIMGPVLLELGLPPQVVGATSTFIVLFSSSLSVLEFYLLGRIPIEVATYFCGLAIVAAFTGLTVVRAYVIRSGKASIIIFLLGGVIGLSGIILGGLGTVRVYEDWLDGADMGFRNVCSREW